MTKAFPLTAARGRCTIAFPPLCGQLPPWGPLAPTSLSGFFLNLHSGIFPRAGGRYFKGNACFKENRKAYLQDIRACLEMGEQGQRGKRRPPSMDALSKGEGALEPGSTRRHFLEEA